MQSKGKTSCRQLADKLRQACDSLAASPGKAITSAKQPVRKPLANGKQVPDKFPKTIFRQNRVYTIDTPTSFPPAGATRRDGLAPQKEIPSSDNLRPCDCPPRKHEIQRPPLGFLDVPPSPAAPKPSQTALLSLERSDARTENTTPWPSVLGNKSRVNACAVSSAPPTLAYQSIRLTFIRKIAFVSTLCVWN
jgi:hypothetical protein